MGVKSGYQHDANLVGSDSMIPIDLQSRYQKTIQVHNAVSVSANSYANSSWIDASGYDKIGLTMLNDADVSTNLGVHWSNDGTGFHANEVVSTGTSRMQFSVIETKARYFRVYVSNKDTASAHTMSAWAYLKV
jgi:hypothetical protein